MKLDVTKVLLDLDNKPIMSDSKPYTLRQAICEALLSIKQGENPSGEEKAKNYGIAIRVQKEDVVELKIEEVATIKARVGAVLLPLGVGRVFDALEGSL